jgi:hypothetical protein
LAKQKKTTIRRIKIKSDKKNDGEWNGKKKFNYKNYFKLHE